ncbi:MAG TPA: hypothetical protein VM534_02585, partial [Thermoanaerobaculia bacterium]|nr:hypothetical protein [Thermoanaerobaculia bacterium]
MTAGLTPPRTLVSVPLADYPSISPFALDLVSGREPAIRFCSRRSIDEIQPSGRKRDPDLI